MATFCPERPPIHYHPGLLYVCSYCKQVLTPERAGLGLQVSHGACAPCAARELAPRLHALMDEVEGEILSGRMSWAEYGYGPARQADLETLLSALRNLAARKVELCEVTAAYYRQRFL